MENACPCYLNGLIVALCIMAHYVMAQLMRRPDIEPVLRLAINLQTMFYYNLEEKKRTVPLNTLKLEIRSSH